MLCPKCGGPCHDDWPIEHQHDDFDLPDELDYGPEPGIWRTREGEEIPYKELGDSHLLNIIAMLRRNRPKTCYLFHGLKGLELEASGRGLSI